MNRRRPPSPSTASAIGREPLLSRDEMAALLVAVICAFASVTLLLSLPVVAHAEEGDGSATTSMSEELGEPGEPDGNQTDGFGDANVAPEESAGQASEESASEGVEAGFPDAGANAGTSTDATTPESPEGVGGEPGEDADAISTDAVIEELAEGLTEGLAERAPDASPAPSNPMSLIIVVAIMGVALAIAFVVSRSHAKPQKLGGTKGDVW